MSTINVHSLDTLPDQFPLYIFNFRRKGSRRIVSSMLKSCKQVCKKRRKGYFRLFRSMNKIIIIRIINIYRKWIPTIYFFGNAHRQNVIISARFVPLYHSSIFQFNGGWKGYSKKWVFSVLWGSGFIRKEYWLLFIIFSFSIVAIMAAVVIINQFKYDRLSF